MNLLRWSRCIVWTDSQNKTHKYTWVDGDWSEFINEQLANLLTISVCFISQEDKKLKSYFWITKKTPVHT